MKLGMLLCLAAFISPALAQDRLIEPRRFTRRLTALDANAGDQFGLGVALHAGRAVIGALGDDELGPQAGGAYVFKWSPSGWRQETKLLASDGTAGDEFGLRVALHGDTAIIGAPLKDGVGVESGSAYVFRLVNGSWVEEAKLLPLDPAARNQFGRWVGVFGDVAVISSHFSDVGALQDAGRAYIFRRVGSSWTQEARLQAPEPQADARFARSVTAAGDTVVIGAVTEDHAAGVDAGSAYVYEFGDGGWALTARLRASDAGPGDLFGNAVFLRRGVLVIGANKATLPGGLTKAGAAYVYTRAGNAWAHIAKLVAPDAASGDTFARSVSTDGNRILIGSILDDNQAGINAGSAYLFRNRSAGWTFERKYVPSSAGPGDILGYTVSVDGTVALAGSYLNDPAGLADAGAAFIF